MVGISTGRYGMGRRRPVSPKTARIASLVTSAAFVALGVFLIFNAKALAGSVSPLPGGQTTTGIILDVSTGQTCGKSGCTPWWQPTIQFTSASDKVVTFTGPQDNNTDEIGNTVRVSYDPSNPSDAHDLSANVGPTRVEIAVGALLVAFALLLIIAGHRRIAGSSNLLAAHSAASTTSDSATAETWQVGATSIGETSSGSWVGHRYLHSRTAFVIADLVFVGLLTWTIMTI